MPSRKTILMYGLNKSRMYWLNVAVAICFMLFAVFFSWSNLQAVHISWLGMSSADVPLYVPVFIAFLLGFSGGMLSLSFSRRKHKQEISLLRSEKKLLRQEVENLRNIPLQDDV